MGDPGIASTNTQVNLDKVLIFIGHKVARLKEDKTKHETHIVKTMLEINTIPIEERNTLIRINTELDCLRLLSKQLENNIGKLIGG